MCVCVCVLFTVSGQCFSSSTRKSGQKISSAGTDYSDYFPGSSLQNTREFPPVCNSSHSTVQHSPAPYSTAPQDPAPSRKIQQRPTRSSTAPQDPAPSHRSSSVPQDPAASHKILYSPARSHKIQHSPKSTPTLALRLLTAIQFQTRFCRIRFESHLKVVLHSVLHHIFQSKHRKLNVQQTFKFFLTVFCLIVFSVKI